MPLMEAHAPLLGLLATHTSHLLTRPFSSAVQNDFPILAGIVNKRPAILREKRSPFTWSSGRGCRACPPAPA
jgi:hypothetical protein